MCYQIASPDHLLLDTETLSTANVKMKTQRILTTLCIIGLLLQNGLAESKDFKEREKRQTYLPPSILPKKIIREEIITIHEESPNSHIRFDESNYGGGKYQIFEVHHHFDPSTSNFDNFNAPAYSPPEQNIQHQHIQQSPPINTNHLDVSSSSYSNNQLDAPHNFPSNHQQSVHETSSSSVPAEEVIRVQHFHINQLKTANVNGGGQSAPQLKNTEYLPPSHTQQSQNTAQYSAHVTKTQHDVNNYRQHEQSDGVQQEIQQPHSLQQADYSPAHHSEQHNQQHQFRGPAYLPPYQTSHQQVQKNVPYKTPGYLPPKQGESRNLGTLTTQQPHHNEIQNQFHQPGVLRKPDYLPPHPTSHQQDKQNIPYAVPGASSKLDILTQQSNYNEVQNQVQKPGLFKGTQYLPPLQKKNQQVQKNGGFKAPGYLPPKQGESPKLDTLTPQHSIDNKNQNTIQQPEMLRGPEYSPPHQQDAEVHHQIQQQTQYTEPEYLPSYYNEQNNHQQHLIQQPYQAVQQTQYHENQHQQYEQPIDHRALNSYPQYQHNNQPNAIPATYSSSKHVEHQITPQSEPFLQQSSLQLSPQSQQFQFPSIQTQLPPGYDFQKPVNAEEAISELHTLPEEYNQQPVAQIQNEQQQQQQQQQAQFITEQPQSSINYQDNVYSPPQTTSQQSNTNYPVQEVNDNEEAVSSSFNQVSPQIFAPPSATTISQNYPPPAQPVQVGQYTSNLHSLTSYMSDIQPNLRYGVTQFSTPHQPFQNYGPPTSSASAIIDNSGPQQQQQEQQPQQYNNLPIAPMYHSQATRPAHYAPAMPYATDTNIYTSHTNGHQHVGYQYQLNQHSTFNQQTLYNLQQLMPQDIQQSIINPVSEPAPVSEPRQFIVPPTSPVPVNQPISTRLRTVQILKSANVKTLRVIETQDQNGSKTIKILGPSESQPTGEHRIVNIVTQNSNNSQEHVQTVKIFNDQKDVSNGESNAYLPPAVRASRQSLSQQEQRQPFTGKRRYRY